MSVKIKIEGDGLSYEGETDALKAARVIELLGARESSSPREALLASRASSYPQKIAALGNYVSDCNAAKMFSLKELKEAFKEAGEPVPKNLARDITAAIALGLIAPTGTRSTYHVTDRGAARPKGTRSDGRRIEELEIEPRLKGFPDYWHRSLKTNKSVRMLWLLEFCSTRGVPELSAADMSHLAKRLGDDIQANTIPSKIKGLAKKGYVVKTADGRLKILSRGSEFLRAARISRETRSVPR